MEGKNGNALDLVGTFEAHLILGVERSRIARWLAENAQGKKKIPVPVARLASGPVWRRSQIESLLRDLAEAQGVDPAGPKFEKWAVERSKQRAKQLGVEDSRLAEIIRRPVARTAARR